MTLPIGPVGDTSQERIQADSTISPEDIAAAVILWKLYAPSRFRGLIDNTSKIYIWDPQAGAWTQNGLPLPSLTIRNQAVEPFLRNIKLQMRGISQQLQSGQISLIDWQIQMIRMVKLSQLAAAMVANGGLQNSAPADYKQAETFIAALLVALFAFAKDVETGSQPLNGTILTRGDLYAAAARDSFSEMDRYNEQVYKGKQYERRVLDSQANHCHTEGDWIGCPELARMGWQPIGTLPRLYDTPCRTNCQCHWEYK